MDADIPVREALILYDEEQTPPVAVVRLSEREFCGRRNLAHGNKYQASCGAAYTYWRDAPLHTLCVLLFVEFNALVVRNKIPAEEVHKAFLRIREYRQLIPSDIKGSEDTGDEVAKALGA